MPRSSRHKSSKHISREPRDNSDPEKDLTFKQKKGRQDSSVSIQLPKESPAASGEKRKALDSKFSLDNVKDLVGPGNVESLVDYVSSSSKRRKEKVDADRWTECENDDREVLRDEMNTNDSKGFGESKSRSSRVEGNLGLGVDGEEVKRSGSMVETKHHRSGRKERSEKEGGSERERNVKNSSKSDKLGDVEAGADGRGNDVGSSEELVAKPVGSNTVSKLKDDLRTPDLNRDSERWVQRKKDDSEYVNKHHDRAREPLHDGRSYSKDDIHQSGRYKDGVQKDKRGKDKYKDLVYKDGTHHDEKLRDKDGRHARDYSHNRSNDKHLRTDKKNIDIQQKKYRPRDEDYDYGNDRHQYSRDHHDHEHDDREHDADQDKEQERDCGRGHGRDHGNERSRDIDHDYERDRDCNHHDRDKERSRDRDFTHERGRDWDHDHDRDYNSHAEDRVSRYKEDRVQRRSPESYNDYLNENSRSAKVEAKVDRDKTLSRGPHVDTMTGNIRCRSSPRSHGVDKYRDHDGFWHGDSSREVAVNSETHDKVSKYRSADKRAKFDDNRLGDLSAEKSQNTKVSGLGLMERSPSRMSADRKYVNLARSGRRLVYDVDETDRRSSGSNDLRDVSVNEERWSRDLAPQKPFAEEHPPVESLLYQICSQGPGAGGLGFRAGVDGPFMGSMGEDSRGHSSRYRRSLDTNFGRSHGNPWKGVPNWPSPLSNGFMPFPPGPHGGFPPIVQQFPSPSIFGVRPSLEMNNSGIPFMSDADRFSGHIRPHGWQHMVEGSGSSHFRGWDANNGSFRDDSMYGAGHHANGRTRDTHSETWKQNGDASLDEVLGPHKDGPVMKTPVEESFGAQGCLGSRNGSKYDEVDMKIIKIKTPIRSFLNKEAPYSPKAAAEKTPGSSSANDTANALHFYISKLDISIELAEPELYDQCINLGVEEQDGNASDDVIDHVHLKESMIATSVVPSPAIGITIFPAAEEDIFQRALDLYKTYCSGRRSLSMANGGEERLQSFLAREEHRMDMVAYPKESVDELVHIGDGATQDKSITPYDVATELFPRAEPEAKEPHSVTNEGCRNDYSSESPEMVVQYPLIGNSDGAISNLIGEKIDDAIPGPMAPKDVTERFDFFVEIPKEVSCSKAIDLVFETGGSEPTSCSEERLASADAINGPSVSTDVSVKVCETSSMSVSHELGSVILSRIHNAPESTH